MVSLEGKGWDLLPAATALSTNHYCSPSSGFALIRGRVAFFFFYPLRGTRRIQLRQEGPTGGERADGGRVESEN